MSTAPAPAPPWPPIISALFLRAPGPCSPLPAPFRPGPLLPAPFLHSRPLPFPAPKNRRFPALSPDSGAFPPNNSKPVLAPMDSSPPCPQKPLILQPFPPFRRISA